MSPLALIAFAAVGLRALVLLPPLVLEARDIRMMDGTAPVPPTAAAERRVETVRIGLIGLLDDVPDAAGATLPPSGSPDEQAAALAAARAVRDGARLAIDLANREGGVAGRPVALLERTSIGPWSQAARRVVDLVHAERVWAILAGPDRDTAHLTLQVAHKAHTPVLLPATADDSLTLGGVPWVFRLAGAPDAPLPAAPAARDPTFAAAWQARHGTAPPPAAALGWDAVRLAVAGLRATGLDRPGLRDWLAAVEGFPGATGPIAFCPNGDRRTTPDCPGRPASGAGGGR